MSSLVAACLVLASSGPALAEPGKSGSMNCGYKVGVRTQTQGDSYGWAPRGAEFFHSWGTYEWRTYYNLGNTNTGSWAAFSSTALHNGGTYAYCVSW